MLFNLVYAGLQKDIKDSKFNGTFSEFGWILEVGKTGTPPFREGGVKARF